MGLLAGTKFYRPPHCERCEKPETECKCPPIEAPAVKRPAGSRSVRVGVEKRKHGRMMTVVRDLNPDRDDLPALLTKLKSACGAGGTITEGLLEIQGAHLERVSGELLKLGFKVR